MQTILMIDRLNLHPGVSRLEIIESVGGLLAYWALGTPKGDTMRGFIAENYCAPLEACEIPGNAFLDSRGYFCYETDDDEPNDPPLPPMIEFERGDEKLIIFQYAICAFISGNDAPYFVRLD